MGVVKNGLVVGGCSVVNSKRWWLWISLVSLVVVGLLLVWANWFVCFWSSFGRFGPLMILAWVDDNGFSLRLVAMVLLTLGSGGC